MRDAKVHGKERDADEQRAEQRGHDRQGGGGVLRLRRLEGTHPGGDRLRAGQGDRPGGERPQQEQRAERLRGIPGLLDERR